MRYVLDANAAIAALNGLPKVRERLAAVPTEDVGLPVVALAELTFGAYKSRRREENLQRIAALRRAIPVLPLTDGVVDLYGATRASLESRGVVKSDFDLLSACTALDAKAILVTSDGGLLDGISRRTGCPSTRAACRAEPATPYERSCTASLRTTTGRSGSWRRTSHR